MAKPELGLKRLCPSCGAKYYDLNRTPVVCPKCGAMFDTASVVKTRSVPVEEDPEEEHETSEIHPEFVPLEEADHPEGEAVPDIEDAEIADDDADDDVFLEEEDEDGGDMSGIIHDVDEEEER